jgi:hypothetical protein
MPYPLETLGDGSVADRNFRNLAKDMNPPVPQARVFNSAAITLTTAVEATLTFDSERFDNGSLHSTSANTGRLTAPITGLYLIGCHVEIAANAAGARYVAFRVNGATFIGYNVQPGSAAGNALPLQSLYQLAATDYVEVRAFQNSGGNLNVTQVANATPEFWMVRLGGYVNAGV